MTDSMTDTQPFAKPDDHVAIFQIDEQPVRGRAVNLGAALDEALGGDRYPRLVAQRLGEAMMIAALVARALKFDGRLLIQCMGTNEGAISLLVADCTTDGNLRGYARYDEAQLKSIQLDNRNPSAEALFGKGTFSMTIDQGPDMDQYQGLASIEGENLSDCAEHYFAQSEQIPTRVKLACGTVQNEGEDPKWRGGGIMIQKIAGDAARGDSDEAWRTAQALFETVSDSELLDPDLSQNNLLYRLFHEDGVRVIDTASVQAKCSCSEARLENTLRSFGKDQIADMAEDGIISANCEFCGTDYRFDIADF
ncbi:MAG: Hsp33 family molecular chaperone [Maricaulaceae bacterium]